jgi:hypothetical protein
MAATNRIDALRLEGLVVEGRHTDVTSISWTEGGTTKRMDVRPLFAPRADVTVWRPAKGQSQTVYQA